MGVGLGWVGGVGRHPSTRYFFGGGGTYRGPHVGGCELGLDHPCALMRGTCSVQWGGCRECVWWSSSSFPIGKGKRSHSARLALWVMMGGGNAILCRHHLFDLPSRGSLIHPPSVSSISLWLQGRRQVCGGCGLRRARHPPRMLMLSRSCVHSSFHPTRRPTFGTHPRPRTHQATRSPPRGRARRGEAEGGPCGAAASLFSAVQFPCVWNFWEALCAVNCPIIMPTPPHRTPPTSPTHPPTHLSHRTTSDAGRWTAVRRPRPSCRQRRPRRGN